MKNEELKILAAEDSQPPQAPSPLRDRGGPEEGFVITSIDVYNALVQALGSTSGTFYYSVYSRIVTHGKKTVKLSMKESSYFKALKIFRDLRISLISTDLQHAE